MAHSRRPRAKLSLDPTSRASRQAPRKRPRLLLWLEALEERIQLSAIPSSTAASLLPIGPMPAADTGAQTLDQIDHFVVIYQENWSFDSLYGLFPGANGLQNARAAGTIPQVDKNGSPLTSVPRPLGPNGQPDTRFPDSPPLSVGPYNLSRYLSPGDKTGDIIHRFYHQQLQIDNGVLQPSNGSMDKFATWSDNPGLVQSYFDATILPEGQLAQQYTMDDNFFHAAYGGSFLNHQFLVAAAAPRWNQSIPANFQSSWDPVTQTLNDSNLTSDGKYAVNTTYSANLVPSFVTPGAATLMQSINDSNSNDPNRPFEQNIGDLLSSADVGWKWYSGGWDAAVNLQKAYQSGDPNQIAAAKAPFLDTNNPLNLFQWHHQPLAYFDNYAPLSPGGQAHLQDETNFFSDLTNGNLPAVSFIKPLGPDNEHPGYASLLQGQQHVKDLVNAIQNSPDWAHTAIIVTYDENGGRWDHVTPPVTNGGWGDGTRVPTIVISPLAKKGYVDHTQHDTLSILKTVEERFGLPSLNAFDASASDLSNDFVPVQPQAPGPDQHVLLLSVDGLHYADVADPSLAADMPNILKLQQGGVSYTNASTTKPSDSFPGTLSYLTGAGPGTTGVFYDDSYSRTLFAPGTNPAQATPGTEVQYTEALDRNQSLLSGGGNFDVSSINPAQLPVDGKGNPVYPHTFLPVNTVFNVAHDAGLYTAFSDKHPAYDIANGHSGNGIDDFYAPEINSTTALLDPSTGKTVDAKALLASDPFTNVSKYILVDPSTDPVGPFDPKTGLSTDPNLINDTTHNLLLTERYDDLKVQAILNEIAGLASHASPGIMNSLIPALFGMNFQAVSVAQKYANGGIVRLPDGSTTPSAVLEAAIRHTDASIGKIVAALQNTKDPLTGGSLWNTTEVILTAKHGQTPRVNAAGLMKDNAIPDLLTGAGAPVAQATQDDVSLIWLKNQADTTKAVNALKAYIDPKSHNTIDVYFQGTKTTLPVSTVIDKVLSGPDLMADGLGNPATNATTPDLIVTLKPGYIWVGNPLNFTFKRAEHGGFSPDDTHVPLIVSGGALASNVRGMTVDTPVQTRQIAVTALNSLGLSAAQLQGAVIEGTKGLPGLGIPTDNTAQFTAGADDQALVGAFNDQSTTDNLNKYKVVIQWGDTLGDRNAILVRDDTNPHIVDVYARHTYDAPGSYDGTLTITPPLGPKINGTLTARVLDPLTGVGETLSVHANQALTLQTVATLVAQDPNATQGDFTARIDWGDGFQSNGVVVATQTKGAFRILGSHTYTGHQDWTYPFTVTIKDTFGSQTVADGTANVTFAPPSPSMGTAPALNPPGTPAGPQGGGTSITPQGWYVSPAGTQTSLGDKPFGEALSPDGKYLAVTNDGAGTQSIMVVDRANHIVIQTIPYNAPEGVYVGIAYSANGTKLYASAGGTLFNQDGTPDLSKNPTGPYNGVRVYNVDTATGHLTETAPILIPRPVGTDGKLINLFTAGLALSAGGDTLCVADNLGNALSVVDLTSDQATTGGAATTLQVGPNPYTVALSDDGKTAYVSNQGGLTVSVVDLTTPFLAENDRIQVGTHPNALALNPRKNELYVANADSDTISVIDTKTNVVVRTIDLSPYLGSREGSSPDALAVSPDGKTLYVANALNNDVAVIQLGANQGRDQVQGLIPTAWYPTGLVLSHDGKELDVLNAKGLGAGPNPGGPNPYTDPYGPPNQYIASMIVGTLSQIVVPDASQLATYTQQVVANNGFNEGSKVRTAGTPQEKVIPLRPGDPTPIKHVIYVIKENRTFDQEFGSLGKGNGDSSLNLFGNESAPNARALEKQFVTLDNFYSDAEVSADGWNWATGAEANSYVQHAWPQNYGGQNRPYDFEGGNLATSPGTDPTDAFIWNKLSDAGIGFRNYGFRVFGGVVAVGTEPRLAANTDLNFAGYDLRKPDSIPDLIQTGVNQPTRIAEWLKEFNAYEAAGTLPTVEFVRLPNDHTAVNTVGAPTPRAYVADNDYALGQLVDAVSHSNDWGSTAIFVIEDDAQEGPDHVDAHRTVAQVISPYTQTGKVDSTFYSQVSVLRTMEQIVGIAPMTQFDAAATPMLNSFTDTPNMTAYTAIVPTQNVHEKNPVNPPLADPTVTLDQVATAVDQNEAAENQGIWKSIKGADSTMPPPKTSFRTVSVVSGQSDQANQDS